MPPLSKELYEEGAAVRSFKLVRRGVFQTDGIVAILNSPSRHPGCSGARNVADCLSDLRAQTAANHRGIQLVHELIAEYGLDVVQAYMTHIQQSAEGAVREMLRQVVHARRSTTLKARDFMDDGTPIELTVEIDPTTGSALFDFTGTRSKDA